VVAGAANLVAGKSAFLMLRTRLLSRCLPVLLTLLSTALPGQAQHTAPPQTTEAGVNTAIWEKLFAQVDSLSRAERAEAAANPDSPARWAIEAQGRNYTFLKSGSPRHEWTKKERALAKSWRVKPERKLYADLYIKVYTEYQASLAPDDRLVWAKRLVAVMDLTQQLAEGQRPELLEAIQKNPKYENILFFDKQEYEELLAFLGIR